LALTIGIHRWNLILRGERSIHQFKADASDGPDWYRRATRAHANCIENLPVFGTIVVIASLTRMGSPVFDALACIVLVTRVAQTTTHVSFRESAHTVSFRFTFFSVQLVAMAIMAYLVVTHSRTGNAGPSREATNSMTHHTQSIPAALR
jgi:uncharacterized MAPEG superfamily protein